MPRTGRPAQPTAIKEAKGETRPSRINHDEPVLLPPSSLQPPQGLTGAGLAEWLRVAQALSDSGVLMDADLSALEDYCRVLTKLRAYEKMGKKAGPELAIAKGYLGAEIKLRAQANLLRRELGLTPSSRSSVRVEKKPKANEDDKFFGGPRGVVAGNQR